MIPGMEPILLDLENLFLLSVSLENSMFQGKRGISKFRKHPKILFFIEKSNFPMKRIAETDSPGPGVSVPPLESS